MSHDKVREAVKSAYNSNSWHLKVDKMSESQVVAVYFRLHSQGKI